MRNIIVFGGGVNCPTSIMRKEHVSIFPMHLKPVEKPLFYLQVLVETYLAQRVIS
jgi:hypothetical protein